MCLIKNNAKVAAQIAVALGQRQLDCGGGEELRDVGGRDGVPVVIGGSILDVHYRVLDDDLEVSRFAFSPRPTQFHTKTSLKMLKARNCFPGECLERA